MDGRPVGPALRQLRVLSESARVSLEEDTREEWRQQEQYWIGRLICGTGDSPYAVFWRRTRSRVGFEFLEVVFFYVSGG